MLTISACLVVGIAIAQKLAHVQGNAIVQMQPYGNVQQLAERLRVFNGVPTQLTVKESLSAPLRIWLLEFDFTEINGRAFVEHLRAQPDVSAAQFNHLIEMRETTPNDPMFNSQWQWVNTGQNGGTPDADVDADLAWDITTGGKTADGRDIVVCVVESANRNHQDLQGNLWFNEAEIPNNDIDDDNNGYVDDYNGWNPTTNNDNIPSASHGTTVSGMIGAKGNNGIMVAGINWDVKIMHVEVGSLTESSVISSYTYPYVMRKRYNETNGQEGAFVVATNSSWGIDGGDPNDSPLWCAFYDSLGSVGILSCGSTTNNNDNVDIVGDLPTGCESEFLVSVTATNRNDVRTFSGYGLKTVDVGAPGESVTSLSTNGTTTNASGTSFASPLTAGIIGLLYSAPCSSLGGQAVAEPAATALLVRDALFNGVDVVPNLVPEIKFGGRVNAHNSLLLLLQNCGPCPAPYNVVFENITDTSALVSWTSTDSTSETSLRYRLAGDTNWVTVPGTSSPYQLLGLNGCSTYEFQFEDTCSDTTSGFSATYLLETEGCCVAPADLSVSQITTTGAHLDWDFVFAANSYTVILTTDIGFQTFTGITEPNFSLPDLTPCTDYLVSVFTVCDTGSTISTEPVAFRTAGCGACTDLTYCPSESTSTTYEWIANVSIGNLDNSTDASEGYAFYDDLGFELTTLQVYDLSLSPGYAGFTYPEWFKVWIDYNQDGDFLDAGEVVYNTGGITTTTVSGQVAVPADAVPGLTRMRVAMRWNAHPNDPCDETFNGGEVEDYCVNIVEGTTPECQQPIGLELTAWDEDMAELSWSPTPFATGYELQYRLAAASDWTTYNAATTTLSVPYECDESYLWQVRADCIGTFSDFSPAEEFIIACPSGTSEAQAGFSRVKTDPNPFSENLTVNFVLNQAGNVLARLYNANGVIVATQSGYFAQGAGSVQFAGQSSLNTWPSGLYFVAISRDGGPAFVSTVVKD